MTKALQRLEICLVDPGCLTPAYNSELSLALAKQGHQVSLVTSPYHNDIHFQFPFEVNLRYLFFKSINFESHPKLRRAIKGLSYAFYYYRFMRTIAVQPPDILHLQWLMIPPVEFYFLRALKNRFPAIKVIVTVHDAKPLFWLPGARYFERVLEKMDAIVVHGETAKRQLIDSFSGLDESKLAAIPHGPLHSSGGDGQIASNIARRRLGLPEQRHIGLFFGEIKAYKGFDVLVDALRNLDKGQRAELTFMAAGKVEDKSCLEHITEFLDLDMDTHLWQHYIPTEEVPVFFSAADFVVLPYRTITQSGILLTALGNGRPVLATKVGELSSVIDMTEGGWLIPEADPVALRDALSEILRESRGSLRNRGERARSRLNECYGWERIAQETLKLYRAAGTTNQE